MKIITLGKPVAWRIEIYCEEGVLAKRLFEKSKIQDFRELASYILAYERAKTGNSDQTRLNAVQNHEILRFR